MLGYRVLSVPSCRRCKSSFLYPNLKEANNNKTYFAKILSERIRTLLNKRTENKKTENLAIRLDSTVGSLPGEVKNDL